LAGARTRRALQAWIRIYFTLQDKVNQELIAMWREYFVLARLRNQAWDAVPDTGMGPWLAAETKADALLSKIRSEIQRLYPGENPDFSDLTQKARHPKKAGQTQWRTC